MGNSSGSQNYLYNKYGQKRIFISADRDMVGICFLQSGIVLTVHDARW